MSSYEEEAHRAWESGDLASAFSCFRLGANDGQLSPKDGRNGRQG